jgi:G:T/U-mismatch repair DNA glycosylase
MHYANPQNHFWPLMREVGFVPHEFGPADDMRLPDEPYRIGFTNIVSKISTFILLLPDSSLVQLF